jgi:hypothetical protein
LGGLHFGHCEGHSEAGIIEGKVSIFNNVPFAPFCSATPNLGSLKIFNLQKFMLHPTDNVKYGINSFLIIVTFKSPSKMLYSKSEEIR